MASFIIEYLYILWDGGINYARRRLRPKSESLSGRCCVQIPVKFLDCRMIPMATFVAELGMMSPAFPLIKVTSRQKNLQNILGLWKKLKTSKSLPRNHERLSFNKTRCRFFALKTSKTFLNAGWQLFPWLDISDYLWRNLESLEKETFLS